MNRWNIPDLLEQAVRKRDRECIYCGITLSYENPVKVRRPSWEHILNDATIITIENIALCCRSCNSSKGSKTLAIWLQSEYCKRKGITAQSNYSSSTCGTETRVSQYMRLSQDRVSDS